MFERQADIKAAEALIKNSLAAEGIDVNVDFQKGCDGIDDEFFINFAGNDQFGYGISIDGNCYLAWAYEPEDTVLLDLDGGDYLHAVKKIVEDFNER